MTNKQLDLLRCIIQQEIYLTLEAQKVERSFDVEAEEERLDCMWDRFKGTFLE